MVSASYLVGSIPTAIIYGRLTKKIQIRSGDGFKRPLKKSMKKFFRLGHRFGLLDGAEKAVAEFKISGKIETKFFKAPQCFRMIKMSLQKPGQPHRTF